MGAIRIKPVDTVENITLIKVVGVGGSGGNAVNYMIEEGINGVEFIAINTDLQDLKKNRAKKKIQIGEKLTGGRGTGGDPQKGEQAAKESTDKIKEELQGAQMVFLTAGMGGGTGTGASPIIAQIAKELGILTVAVVTLPFRWERRDKIAEEGIKRLKEIVNSIIIIPNERLHEISGGQLSLINAFNEANRVLYDAVKGISDLVVSTGLINVDFEDVKSVMKEGGVAIMGTGYGEGENRVKDAIDEAIENPLVEHSGISGARGVLLNFVAGEDLLIDEVVEGAEYISNKIAPDAFVKFGAFIDKGMEGGVKITIVATGFGEKRGYVGDTVPEGVGIVPPQKGISAEGETINWGSDSKTPNSIESVFGQPAYVNSGEKENPFNDEKFGTPTFMRKKNKEKKKKGFKKW